MPVVVSPMFARGVPLTSSLILPAIPVWLIVGLTSAYLVAVVHHVLSASPAISFSALPVSSFVKFKTVKPAKREPLTCARHARLASV